MYKILLKYIKTVDMWINNKYQNLSKWLLIE